MAVEVIYLSVLLSGRYFFKPLLSPLPIRQHLSASRMLLSCSKCGRPWVDDREYKSCFKCHNKKPPVFKGLDDHGETIASGSTLSAPSSNQGRSKALGQSFFDNLAKKARAGGVSAVPSSSTPTPLRAKADINEFISNMFADAQEEATSELGAKVRQDANRALARSQIAPSSYGFDPRVAESQVERKAVEIWLSRQGGALFIPPTGRMEFIQAFELDESIRGIDGWVHTMVVNSQPWRQYQEQERERKGWEEVMYPSNADRCYLAILNPANVKNKPIEWHIDAKVRFLILFLFVIVMSKTSINIFSMVP